MKVMLSGMFCLNSDPLRRSVSMVGWTRCPSASIVASWMLRGQMDDFAVVVVEPAVGPVMAAAGSLAALNLWT